MEAEPDIAAGAVMILQRVAVLVCGKQRYLTVTLPMIVQVSLNPSSVKAPLRALKALT